MSTPELFELHVRRDGRWGIEETSKSEAEAIETAKRKIRLPDIDGVRVVREGDNRFGRLSVNTVFSQEKPRGDSGPVVVGRIDRAPACEERDALYGVPARQTMAKLFKGYLAKLVVTPTEVMHNAREMKRVMDRDTLVSTAIGRVANLQTGGDQAAAKGRRDMLSGFVDEIATRARDVEKVALPSIAKLGPDGLAEDVAGKARTNAEADYLLRVAISRDLVNERTWFGKLDSTVGWATSSARPKPIAALDDFIADTLNDAALVQDLLGPQPDLVAALKALLELIDGRVPHQPAKPDTAIGEVGATAGKLAALFEQDKLPGARSILLDRVRNELAGPNPLTRGPAADEGNALHDLALRLVPAMQDLVGGPDMAEAIVERQSRIANRGGAAGRREAVEAVCRLLAEPARQVRFLVAVQESSTGPAVAETVDDILDRLIVKAEDLAVLAPKANSDSERLSAATGIFYQLDRSRLEPRRRDDLTRHIDQLLLRHIRDTNLIARLDAPERALRERAELLISLCLPEILPPGEAAMATRQIIVDYLRQPNFEEKVVADLTDAVARANALRRLFDLMRRAGFR
ncbi:MAG: hypothetical protein ACT7A5_11925 [Ferrovibrionaceae bacterium]